MKSIDLFNSSNYELQREELLARIAEALQLDATRKKRMESAYNGLSSLINNDDGFFKNIDCDVYVQGSVGIGATTKPLKSNEFDLDIVLHIKSLYTNYTPNQIYTALLKLIEGNGMYKDKIERKNRCIRIKYANDFHMDIMPGCVRFVFDDQNIKVPDRELKNWTNSNPKGFIKWFLNRCKISTPSLLQNYRNKLSELKAEIQDLPSDDFYNKSPLQRALQLVKRSRDIYFEKDDSFATSSIVLTTLMAQLYAGENSIYYTLENIILKIKTNFEIAIRNGEKFKVLNPVNEEENFTDSWSSNHYDHFYAFINFFYIRWESIKNSFEKSADNYINLFGESQYKESLKTQYAQMAKYSSNQLDKSSALIISQKAFTDRNGQTNSNSGYKNEHHHNYGE